MEPVKQLQEAINWEALKLCLNVEERQLEALFNEIETIVPLGNPLTLHPNIYSKVSGVAVEELLRAHSQVKSAFFKLAPHDRVLKRGDPHYPPSLEFPRFLYARGNLELLKQRSVTLAGTGNVSNEGKENTVESVKALVKEGVAIVAGLNLGIEGIAHLTSLAEGGMSIGVLSTPLTETFPESHKQLQDLIGQRGLLLTQFSPLVKLQRWHIILRNRVLAYLTEGTLLIEERDGGSGVKQAFYALEANKRVVIFSQLLEQRTLVWPKRLIQRQGVFTVKDAKTLYPLFFPEKKKQSHVKPLPQQFSLFELS